MNLIEGLMAQMERNREILTYYDAIPQGVFGATMIRKAITTAERAIATGDTVAMVKAFKELESTK